MISKITSFTRENIAAILFIVVIVFAGFSIWSSNFNRKDRAIELLDYTKQVTQQASDRIDVITAKTKLTSNTPEKYDEIISDLKDFEQEINKNLETLPTSASDIKSKDLQSGLIIFLRSIKEQSTTPWIGRLTKQKTLIDDYTTYGKLQERVESGQKSLILESYTSGSKILEFERSYLENLKDKGTRNSKEKFISTESVKLEKLKNILDSAGDVLTLSQKNEIEKAYEGLWPLPDPIFPKISESDFKTEQFKSNLKNLQELVNEVVRDFDIN